MSVIKNSISNMIYRFRGEISTDELIRRGLTVGRNFQRLNQVMIDDSHPWLIEIGDDVTLAPRVHIIAHDASTKQALGFTKIGRVTIGDRVFVGAESVILPGVSIGNDVVVGANSTVTRDVEDGVVIAGSPAKVICSTADYLAKEKEQMESSSVYAEDYTLRGSITEEKKNEQKNALAGGKTGYVT